ncbi:hypothetical protein P154DRAFT_579493 [Amniculicola lignicola CBS 123094]|uniref:Uncharacterized protein n=1 Tax=Amniculicola lignicola CBS 123094 TaxID=1392246 RepID=A0A6A5W4R6_9PLEO|nr:hypothetical protein P154DRAFT_579493 [Amniculicola lignicola CBS 123094]
MDLSFENQDRKAFAAAASSGHQAIMELIIDRASERIDTLSKSNTLSLAIREGEDLIVDFHLRQTDVLLGEKDEKGRSPLSYIAEGDMYRVCNYLLRNGANDDIDIYIKDNTDHTAFTYAAGTRYINIVQLFLASRSFTPSSLGDAFMAAVAASHKDTAEPL